MQGLQYVVGESKDLLSCCLATNRPYENETEKNAAVLPSRIYPLSLPSIDKVDRQLSRVGRTPYVQCFTDWNYRQLSKDKEFIPCRTSLRSACLIPLIVSRA